MRVLRAWGQHLAIERVQHYGTGMPVGRTIFDTVEWSGRFIEAWGGSCVTRIPRPLVKATLCGSVRAKDANVRQALIDRLGPPGTKAKPGRTYGMKRDLWAALAVAVTFVEAGLTGEPDAGKGAAPQPARALGR